MRFAAETVSARHAERRVEDLESPAVVLDFGQRTAMGDLRIAQASATVRYADEGTPSSFSAKAFSVVTARDHSSTPFIRLGPVLAAVGIFRKSGDR